MYNKSDNHDYYIIFAQIKLFCTKKKQFYKSF